MDRGPRGGAGRLVLASTVVSGSGNENGHSGPRDGGGSITTLAIEANGLVKTYDTVKAVDGVDLAVRRGTVYGVLGPNGAGKTTTIRMLATLLRPDAGSARVLGHTTSWRRPTRCTAWSA